MKAKNLLVLSTTLLLLAGCSFKSINFVSPAHHNQFDDINFDKQVLTYCEDNGGSTEIIYDEGDARGTCNFDDGSFCEIRAYYHGQCSKGRGHGNTIEVESGTSVSGFENIDMTNPSSEGDQIMCTADVKKCPDGSYVSRGGPNCEFNECPGYVLKEGEEVIGDIIQKYQDNNTNSGSDLAQEDIDLMDDVINAFTNDKQ